MTKRIVASMVLAASWAASPALAGARGVPGETIPVTVDFHSFTLGFADRGDTLFDIFIDVASVEAELGEDDLFHHVDLNDDGEAAFIDSYIYVFESNPAGRGGLGDLVDFNDDDELDEGTGDGSIHSFDSFLRLTVPGGDYVIAISTYNFSEEEARAGMNLVSEGPFTIAADQSDWEDFDHGDYEITVAFDNPIPSRGGVIYNADGTIYVVPAPAAFGAFGLVGVALARRRRA